ncbi:FAD-dependent oxidoreductase [Arabiibacter massiliensis]|uniref:FAD-dependent oxidoreductase n=1 Tax=Arabiibacter massiliensis TaxID=1870985 RepID=UPI00155A1084|nr:FAD-dependent oxidoreductase [Arabiibacter massiliensis]
MQRGFTRRTFVAGGIASLAAMGLAGCAPTTPTKGSDPAPQKAEATPQPAGMQGMATGVQYEYFPPPAGTVAYVSDPVQDDQISSTEEYDLVVCGAGIAGLTLAAASAQNGLKTALLEKTSSFNVRGHDIGSISCKLVKEAGIEFDEDAYFNDALKSSLYRCNIDLWKTWIKHNGEAVDWLVDAVKGKATAYLNQPGGATDVFNGIVTYNDQIQFEEGLEAMMQALLELAEANGAVVRFDTPACQLTQDGDGKVTGVIAKDKSGSYSKLLAGKGVALCTGGYENNWEMLQKSMRPEDLCVVAWRLPNTENTGDGHLMGESVGGVMDPYPHVMMRDPGGSVVAKKSSPLLSLRFPRVNMAGQRFVNECTAPNYVANAIMRQSGGRDYIVLAGETLSSAIESTSYRSYTMSAAKREPDDLAKDAEDIIIQAETIEELAEKTGIDAANLKATFERMTELHELGEDLDWGADTGMMMSFAKGPYYAAEEGGANLVTVSGLRVTSQSEVINASGLPIPGLYALGNCSGDMFSDSYPHEFSGISHSRCVVFAYLLAKRLAE